MQYGFKLSDFSDYSSLATDVEVPERQSREKWRDEEVMTCHERAMRCHGDKLKQNKQTKKESVA